MEGSQSVGFTDNGFTMDKRCGPTTLFDDGYIKPFDSTPMCDLWCPAGQVLRGALAWLMNAISVARAC